PRPPPPPTRQPRPKPEIPPPAHRPQLAPRHPASRPAPREAAAPARRPGRPPGPRRAERHLLPAARAAAARLRVSGLPSGRFSGGRAAVPAGAVAARASGAYGGAAGQYDELLQWLDEQFDQQVAPESPAGEQVQIALLLIKAYEDEHYAIPSPDAITAIQLKMSEQGLKAKDLVGEIGSKSYVSAILNRPGRAIDSAHRRAKRTASGLSRGVSRCAILFIFRRIPRPRPRCRRAHRGHTQRLARAAGGGRLAPRPAHGYRKAHRAAQNRRGIN
nr:hypothetical protein [Tanacetum cinerariifolium]